MTRLENLIEQFGSPKKAKEKLSELHSKAYHTLLNTAVDLTELQTKYPELWQEVKDDPSAAVAADHEKVSND